MSERRRHLEEMLKEEPEDVFLNYALGLEHLADGDPSSAIAQFAHVTAMDPGNVAAWQQWAQTLANSGNTEEAIDKARKGLIMAQQRNDRKAAGELNELIMALEE